MIRKLEAASYNGADTLRGGDGMINKLERVPVKITVTLEFDRPEFPMLATRLAVAKNMSLERYYT